LSQNEAYWGPVDLFSKSLKINIFILQKNLDTPLLRLIRFRQKVLTGFSPPLELFSLEEKAAHVAGRPFRFGAVLGNGGITDTCRMIEASRILLRAENWEVGTLLLELAY